MVRCNSSGWRRMSCKKCVIGRPCAPSSASSRRSGSKPPSSASASVYADGCSNAYTEADAEDGGLEPLRREEADDGAHGRPMTHFLHDILRQPDELQRTIEYLCRPRLPALDAAAAAIRDAQHVYLTGIGSSWHAALNAGALFYQNARPVYMQDAAELLQFATFPKNSVILIL